MMRSLFAGVSALRNHQLRMDVISNNIANVNTAGFKSSRVTFHELMSQSLREASAPQGDRGGLNPMQVGLGASLGTVNVQHTQGNTETTGVTTDLAIEGNGFFVLAHGSDRYFTRAGMFDVDVDGNLVSSVNGLNVVGWQADQDGNIATNRLPDALKIPNGATILPKSTTSIRYSGNLDARDNGSLTFFPSPTAEITDNGGQSVQLVFKVVPTGNFNEFQWEVVAANGTFSTPTGGIIRLDHNGEVIDQSAPGDIVLNLGNNDITIRPPQVGDAGGGSFSWDADDDGNLDDGTSKAIYQPAKPRITTISVFDSLGNTRDVVTKLYKVGDNTWEWIAEDATGNRISSNGGDPNAPGTILFDASGNLLAFSGEIRIPATGGGEVIQLTPDFGAVTQFVDEGDVLAAGQDGYPAGILKSFSIDSNGVVTGSFSNGLNKQLGQVALATFANAAGLRKSGETMYESTGNSGAPQIGAAGSGNFGLIRSGALEMSNVDLSVEFTSMIITQRGFQANSRIITASDELLQELVNLKR